MKRIILLAVILTLYTTAVADTDDDDVIPLLCPRR